MEEKFKQIRNRFKEISDLMVKPEIISDQKKYIDLNKEYKELSRKIEKFDQFDLLNMNIKEAEDLIKKEEDKEMLEMARLQLEESKIKLDSLEQEIKLLLIPKDPEDSKNVVFEIRAGTGGDEASIFAGDLYRMYTKFCQDLGWEVSLVDFNEGTAGGFKEIIFEVLGEEVYSVLKYESGVHRVQRVPQTETQGRVHTSAATVMVLPDAEEFDVKIDMNDVRVDFYCSSGPVSRNLC